MSNKKPWEYKEIVVEQGVGGITNEDLFLYAGPELEVGCVMQEAPGGAKAWANIFQASPALARSLLREIREPDPGEYHTYACLMERRGIRGPCINECKEAIGALKLAGALS